jgi:hypothetical protein
VLVAVSLTRESGIAPPQTSAAQIEWKVAHSKTEDMCAFMARVMAPPVFCIMKGTCARAEQGRWGGG